MMANPTKIKPLVPWYGGKARMAQIIADKLPPHRIYVEPYGGAAGVLMAKTPSHIEVYNDLHDGIVTLFRVVRDPLLCRQLLELLELTPYARSEWKDCNSSWALETDPVEKARKVFVTLAQNFVGQTAGGSWSFGGVKCDYNVAKTFFNRMDDFKAVAKRFNSVQIENQPALTVMARWQSSETLIYCDPPYLPETRVGGLGDYLHELSADNHTELLDFLLQTPCQVILSGYYSELYATKLENQGWKREDYTAMAASAMQSVGNGLKGKPIEKTKRIECLWFSPNCLTTPTLWDFEREVI